MEELILKERQFKENMVKTINDSELPAFIIKPILKELFQQIDLLESEQYKKAVKFKERKVDDDKKNKK